MAESSIQGLTDLEASDPLRVVVIGGGTGLSALLHGLKGYVHRYGEGFLEITAVVTVTDDGGSSGRLRREFDMLPPGDIRNCMVALSEDEALLSKLFQYRFPAGRGLGGHSFGNLFLTALTHVTGDFAHAIELSSEILAIAGRIYPSTAANVTLEAVLEDGRCVQGETNISKSRVAIQRVHLKPRRCQPLAGALAAIDKADLICLGPGSLYTSVVPNLLVQGIPEAIAESRAIKAYFNNIMWQPGETTGYSAADHVNAITRHAKRPLLDCAVVNTAPVSPLLRRRYALQYAEPVKNDFEALEALGLRVIRADLLGEGDHVRHDPAATAQVALELAMMSRADRRMLANRKSPAVKKPAAQKATKRSKSARKAVGKKTGR